MQPIEINAGAWYLRALRADDRLDDRPALRAAGIPDPDYVSGRTAEWDAETRFSWAVCEPTTAEVVAEVLVTISDAVAWVDGWAVANFSEALDQGISAVERFVAGAWECTPVRVSGFDTTVALFLQRNSSHQRTQ